MRPSGVQLTPEHESQPPNLKTPEHVDHRNKKHARVLHAVLPARHDSFGPSSTSFTSFSADMASAGLGREVARQTKPTKLDNACGVSHAQLLQLLQTVRQRWLMNLSPARITSSIHIPVGPFSEVVL